MNNRYNSIQKTLEGSGATHEYGRDINQHIGLNIWTNQNDHVSYQNINHHTLSVYMEGGYSTWRRDQKYAGKGAPEKLCIFPAQHTSDWEVGEMQRFAHLYFSDTLLRRIALETFDIDPRRVELQDITFFDDEHLLQQYQHLLNQPWDIPEQHLALEENIITLITDVLQRYGVNNITSGKNTLYRSGLSPVLVRRIIDYMHHHIDQKITLDDLAQTAQMSAFHFARMFKISTGETPHQKLLSIRITHAAELIQQGTSQIDTALQCGFANQSHFSRAFKKHYGITPKQFLRCCSNH